MKAEPEQQSAWRHLRLFAVSSGLAVAILFVVLGTATRLEMYGDGSIFSYAVAAQEAWVFHWHNISGRLFTYVFTYILPEQIVAFTGNPRAGIVAYGLLFFSAPLLGLLLTFLADRSRDRVVFTYACASTVCLCPLVFGAPTEMWMAHAVFWPALAVCICAPLRPRGTVLVCFALLALVFTHEGAIVLAVSILAALFLRGGADAALVRASAAFCAAMVVWAAVKLTIRPDDYIAGVIAAAAFRFIDVRNLAKPAFLTLLAAIAAYSALSLLLHASRIERPRLYATLFCTASLAVFWVRFDHWLLAEARYDLRTVLLISIPALGLLATLQTRITSQRERPPLPVIRRGLARAQRIANPGALAGALALVLLAHAVETGKFIVGWLEYKNALRALAAGAASDPQLGSPLFVSSRRLPAKLNRLAWNSTTPFLSVLVAPDLKPARLVVDPSAGYFWLSCQTAKQSESESRALPDDARRLIRLHACLHRPN